MDFEIILLLGLAGAYFVRCLLLEEKLSHEGPFKLKSTFILFPDTGHIQNASLFDIIRFVCGAYYKSEDSNDFQTIWEPHPDRSERFTCPHCLSFWSSLLLSLPYVLLFGLSPFEAVVAHFAIATLSTLIYGIVDYVLQL